MHLYIEYICMCASKNYLLRSTLFVLLFMYSYNMIFPVTQTPSFRLAASYCVLLPEWQITVLTGNA